MNRAATSTDFCEQLEKLIPNLPEGIRSLTLRLSAGEVASLDIDMLVNLPDGFEILEKQYELVEISKKTIQKEVRQQKETLDHTINKINKMKKEADSLREALKQLTKPRFHSSPSPIVGYTMDSGKKGDSIRVKLI